MTSELRTRRDEDLEALTEILARVHERDAYPRRWPRDPVGFLTVAQPLSAHVLVVEGRPVGHVVLREVRDEPSAAFWSAATNQEARQLCVVTRLFVDPDYRGHGFGDALLKHALSVGRSLGRRAVLDVLSPDVAARGFYERRGWRLVGSFAWRHVEVEDLSILCFVSPEESEAPRPGRVEGPRPA